MGYTGNRIDIIGRRFGQLTVERLAPHDSRYNDSMWACRCDCGAECVARGSKLRQGKKRSCGRKGCYSKLIINEVAAEELKIWQSMQNRCYNKRDSGYRLYGKRGIKMCPQWKNNFAQFISDMRPRPSSKHSVDRYPNNDGNYEPGNCRWATQKEQMRNTRKTVFVEFDGQRQPLVALAEQFGLTRRMVFRRLERGWSLEDALLTPSTKGKPK